MVLYFFGWGGVSLVSFCTIRPELSDMLVMLVGTSGPCHVIKTAPPRTHALIIRSPPSLWFEHGDL